MSFADAILFPEDPPPPDKNDLKGIRPTTSSPTRWKAYGPAAPGGQSVYLGTYPTRDEAVLVLTDWHWASMKKLYRALADAGVAIPDLRPAPPAPPPKPPKPVGPKLTRRQQEALEDVRFHSEIAEGAPVLTMFPTACAQLAAMGLLVETTELGARARVTRRYSLPAVKA